MNLTPKEVSDIQAIVNDEWLDQWLEISKNQIDARFHAIGLLIKALRVARAAEKVVRTEMEEARSPEKILYIVLTERTCWGVFSSLQLARETAIAEQICPCRIEEYRIDGGPGKTYRYDEHGKLILDPPEDPSFFRKMLNLITGG